MLKHQQIVQIQLLQDIQIWDYMQAQDYSIIPMLLKFPVETIDFSGKLYFKIQDAQKIGYELALILVLID